MAKITRLDSVRLSASTPQAFVVNAIITRVMSGRRVGSLAILRLHYNNADMSSGA